MTAMKTFRGQRGFTLVEVLVALVVLSIGLLGLAGLQSQGLAGNSDALMRSQATLYVYDMIERMRVNRDEAMLSVDNPYEISFGGSLPSPPLSLADNDVISWLETVATLPGGDGEIVINDTSAGTEATVRVRYRDRGGFITVSVDTAL